MKHQAKLVVPKTKRSALIKETNKESPRNEHTNKPSAENTKPSKPQDTSAKSSTHAPTDSQSDSRPDVTGTKVKEEPVVHEEKTKRPLEDHNEGRNKKQIAKKIKTEPKLDPVAFNKLQQARRALPIFKAKQKIMKAIKDNSSVIIVGETGSGKTTQIPQYLHEEGYTKTGCIAVTQPRRVAAVTIAKRVAKEMGASIGDLVGYNIRFEDVTSKSTRIKYLTDGMLLREAMIDPLLSKYSVVVLDEAHERTLNTDILFAVIKDVMKRRDDLRTIVMSATLEAEKFSGYFNAPVMPVTGRTHPVEILYSEKPQPDYLDSTIVTIFRIHFEQEDGDILCFLTGREEIEDVDKLLEEKIQMLPPDSKTLLVCPIYAALPPDQQLKVFEPAPPNTRKVILATNIAETSITINGIKYVIDPGVVKSKSYNPRIGMDTLLVQPVSKASAMQRAGRAGRESSGICYRLYTEETFDSLEESTIPEIQRSNLASVVLQLKTIGIDDLLSFDFMDKPPLEALKRALEVLIALGALDQKLALTSLGKRIAQLPLEPSYAKVVLTAQNMGVLHDVLSVVAMMSVETVFFLPRDKRLLAERARSRFFHDDGDQIALLGVYQEYINNKAKKQWCWDNFINPKAMKKVMDVRNQLVDYMAGMGTPESALTQTTAIPDSEKIRKSFVSGFARNAAQLQLDKKTYITILDNKVVHMHPLSALMNRRVPTVLYTELIYTTKEFMRNVIKIDQVWLSEMAPTQFKKIKVDTPREADKTAAKKAAAPKSKFAHFTSMVDERG